MTPPVSLTVQYGYKRVYIDSIHGINIRLTSITSRGLFAWRPSRSSTSWKDSSDPRDV